MSKSTDPVARQQPSPADAVDTFDPYENSGERPLGRPASPILPEAPANESEGTTIETAETLPDEGAGMRDGGLPGNSKKDL
jgi:hypothetical protein